MARRAMLPWPGTGQAPAGFGQGAAGVPGGGPDGQALGPPCWVSWGGASLLALCGNPEADCLRWPQNLFLVVQIRWTSHPNFSLKVLP